MKLVTKIFLTLLLFMSLKPVLAQLKMPYLFSDHMVLQRDTPLKIWGWGLESTDIDVYLGDKVYHTVVKNGEWQVSVDALTTGKTLTLKVTDGYDTLTYNDILVGDVWVCSGQSNMEWSLKNANNAKAEISNANYPEIRLFTVPKDMFNHPRQNTKEAVWEICEPSAMPDFTAVGYFFGRHLHQQLDVPIGLIDASWGGTMIETWTSQDAYLNYGPLKNWLSKSMKLDFDNYQIESEKKREQWFTDLDSFDEGLKKNWQLPEYSDEDWDTMELPQTWEAAGYQKDGFFWFRKDFNLSTIPKDSVTLSLGPIDDSDITYINGKKVGEMDMKYNTPRVYKIAPEVLRSGRNVIAVRVKDTGGEGGINGSADQLYLLISKEKMALSGKWKYKIGSPNLPERPSWVGPNAFPSILFNGMIAPIVSFQIKGVIWYQGENNSWQPYPYRERFPMLIKDWRYHWGQGNFPFLFVQLANYKPVKPEPSESDWALLREAQMMALKEPNTSMAVTIDIGKARDIHPRNKQDVGLRLAKAALCKAYGQDNIYQGPVFEKMDITGNKIILTFSSVGEGLKPGKKLNAFAISGTDQEFKWAEAEVTDVNQVTVWNSHIADPVAVRYAWADNPGEINFYNSAGLPASPFRTDTWKKDTREAE